jgi:syringomycin synthetase protein SyrE
MVDSAWTGDEAAPRLRSHLLNELFEEQVERTPDVIAVRYGDQSVTYAELNRKANQLARYLRTRGVGPDQLVGLCLERGIEMLTSVVGIWKAGGAYVPLSTNYPAERMAAILQDAGPGLVLTQRHIRSAMGLENVLVATLEDTWSEMSRLAESNLDSGSIGLAPDHVAYVIYTSGSTGRPNGVMIEHRNVCSYWPVITGLYRLPVESMRIALNAPFTFDVSVQQFILLLSGCTLYVIPDEVRQDAAELVRFIDVNRIEAIDCTPSQLNVWLLAGLLEKSSDSLKTVIVGGEAMDESLWKRLTQCNEIDFYNVYGPTESTVFCTTAYLKGEVAPKPHIGRPTSNAYIRILDDRLLPVTPGDMGEICIGGRGVGRGYLNRPELTAARFITDPLSEDPQARLYRSGDLARWRPDGAIEYCGRNDHQIKIRGFRIEPGEIEAHLRRHARVADAVVIAREDSPGEKRLAAYVTPRAGSDCNELETHDLRAWVSAGLPDYMTPSSFVVLPTLPLTSNGKLDRQALPAPAFAAGAAGEDQLPQGETEEALAAIWREVLLVKQIGRHDNFLALGGHSVLGMRLLVNVATRFSIRVSLPDLNRYPTIREMAEFVECSKRESQAVSA